MSNNLDQIIKEYGLENTTIKRGRRKIHPLREGATMSPEHVADLESVLKGNSVKGFLEIKAADDFVIASNVNGAIKIPFDPYGPDGPNSSEGEEFESQYLEHMEKNPHLAKEMDQQALLNALDRNTSPEEVKEILEKGVYVDLLRREHLSEQIEQIYIAPMLEQYEKMRIDAKSRFEFQANPDVTDPMLIPKQADLFEVPLEVEQAANQKTYEELTSTKPLSYYGLSLEDTVDPERIAEERWDYGGPDPGLSSEEVDRREAIQQSIQSPQQDGRSNLADKIEDHEADPYLKADPNEFEPHPALDGPIVAPDIESARTKTEQEAVAARDTYFELLKEHPDFEDLVGVTTRDELLEQPASIQQMSDRQASEMAIERGFPQDELKRVIDQGSPYVQQQREAGALSTVQRYQTNLWFENQYQFDHQTSSPQRDSYMGLSDAFYNASMYPGDEYSDLYAKALKNPAQGKQNDTQVVLAAFRLNHSPEKLEEALSESPYLQSQLKKGVPFSEMQATYIKPLVDQYSQYWQAGNEHGSPELQLRLAIEKVKNPQAIAEPSTMPEATKSASNPPPVDVQEMLHKNQDGSTQSTADTIKNKIEHGTEAAKKVAFATIDTLELAQKSLNTFAKEVKQSGLKNWAKNQIPILQNKATKFAQKQYENAQEYVKTQGPQTIKAIDSGLEKLYEKVASYTQIVDPAKVEAFGNRVLAKDNSFEGKMFDFKRGEKGVEISLKNGQNVFSDGKVNPKIDGVHIYNLSETIKKSEQPVETNKRALSR
jgi:hypothetical protein